jgi:hypothetical protein
MSGLVKFNIKLLFVPLILSLIFGIGFDGVMKGYLLIFRYIYAPQLAMFVIMWLLRPFYDDDEGKLKEE